MTTHDPTPVIEVRDLVKVYGETRALDGITFDVAPGELFGFLGPNGAGKTTTIRILATLLQAHLRDGAGGRLRRRDSAHQVRKRLGLAMQTPTLDAFSTGRETLELAGRLHRMPAGRGAPPHRRAAGADGPDRRGEEADRHLLRRHEAPARPGQRPGAPPALLILDEPTEGLDPQSRTALWEELERISAAGHDHAADHALHGGGRPALHAAGHHRQRPDRGGGRAGRAQGGHRRRHRGAAVEPRRRRRHRSPAVRHRWVAWWRPTRSAPTPPASAWPCPTPSAAIPALLRRLDGDGMRITGLQMRQPSLDDVFMKYTGRHIREEAADQPIILGW